MEEQKIEQFKQLIIDLNIKYKDKPYMLQRLEMHLIDLHDILEREEKRYNERVTRITELTLEQENFHKVFLSKHQYFYMPYNNIYYEYDGKTYKIVKDDDIHYKLLSTITDEGKLIQWKHKTKQNIIKKIKERILIKSTPETYTIQNVLGFLQTIFQTKTEAKYFLTILGDCILKKNTDNLLYFVSSGFKKIISLIDSIVYVTTGISIMNNFITKYHDTHKLELYRLIKTNETNTISIDIIKDVLNNIGIDILCVATHYSDRYENADNYLKTKNEDEIKKYVLYFMDNSLHDIVNKFVEQCIEFVSSEKSEISWKNMHYIWKIYLSSINVPNMVYSLQLQEQLMSKIHSNDDKFGNIIFKYVTSKYLPDVSSFLSFWDKYIIITADTSNDDEYEIDELLTLYKHSDKKNVQLTDTTMIKMISHYFSPQVEVVDNKYVTNIKCNLWSKSDDINEFLDLYKFKIVNAGLNPNPDIISIDDLYESYKAISNSKTVLNKKVYPIISKQFFEKYVAEQLKEFIKFDKFVSSEWLIV